MGCCRSTVDIVWSCIATLLACIWVALHPDILNHRTPLYARLLFYKPFASVTALLIPEMIVTQACLHWLRVRTSLRRIRCWALQAATKTQSDNGTAAIYGPYQHPAPNGDYSFVAEWTATHAAFYEMGGFELLTLDEKKVESIKLREILFLAKRGHVELRDITKQIQDRSTANRATKTFACIQTGWFFAQCIARAAQRLPITELEIATVGNVVITLITYGFCWNKPQDVVTKVPILITPRALEEFNAFRDREYPDDLRNFSHAGPDPDRYWGLLIAIFGFIFGAIHIAAWSFDFPTEVERTLWRVSSIAVTVLPLFFWVRTEFREEALLQWPISLDDVFPREKHINNFHHWNVVIFAMSVRVLYVTARFVLIVECFWCLRSMPPEIHRVVQWTTFLPHV